MWGFETVGDAATTMLRAICGIVISGLLVLGATACSSDEDAAAPDSGTQSDAGSPFSRPDASAGGDASSMREDAQDPGAIDAGSPGVDASGDPNRDAEPLVRDADPSGRDADPIGGDAGPGGRDAEAGRDAQDGRDAEPRRDATPLGRDAQPRDATPFGRDAQTSLDAQPQDAQPATDAGTTAGAISCTTPAAYDTRHGSACGSLRWAIKTGSDPQISSVNFTPQAVTIAQLNAIPTPAPLPRTNRLAPTETQTFILRNVTLTHLKMEPDSDYHLVVGNAGFSMIAEIPFPNCVSAQAASCFITHARGALEQRYSPGSTIMPNVTITVVGIGFWDQAHGQTGAAVNGLELHPVLAMCFGTDCDPMAN